MTQSLGYGVMFLAGAVSGWLWAIKPEILNAVHWLDVMIAFGTVGAAIAAVWISTAQNVRRKREDIERAHLAAAAMALKIVDVLVSVRLAIDWLGNVRDHDGDPEKFEKRTADLEDLGLWTLDDLAPLIPLPNSCSHNLAAGLDRLDKGRKALRKIVPSAKSIGPLGAEHFIFPCGRLSEWLLSSGGFFR